MTTDESCALVVSWGEPAGTDLDGIADGPPVQYSILPHTQRGQIDCYIGAYCENLESQDAFLVVREPGRDILAVADGVTPTPRQVARRALVPDDAAFAARTVLRMVERFRHLSLEKAFEQANNALLDIDVHRDTTPRDRPQSAAAVAEITYNDSGAVQRVDICRAADCDVWVHCGGSWSLVTSDDMVRTPVRDQLDRWDADHRAATLEERLDFEATLPLDDPASWNCTALGRFATAKVCTTTLAEDQLDFADILVVTDGARLRCNDWTCAGSPDAWIGQLRTWEHRNLPGSRPHSDVAMLWLRRPEVAAAH
ncbi:hypothetical protein BH23ACT10_BH23ACT10_29210 [soil metagenome]